MAYNPRTAIRRFGLTPEEDAMRTPVSLPLAGPLPAGLADDITDATVRGVRADQRAASTDAATSALTGQPPIIDLGDESEFIIPREEPSNLFGLADDDESGPFNVQSRPASVREPARDLSSTPSAPRFAPAPEPTGRFSEVMPGWTRAAHGQRGVPGQPLLGGPLPRLSDVGLVDDESDPPGTTITHADGTTTVVGAPAVAPTMADPDDDVIGGDIEAESENATDIDADADLSVSEPLDPRRRAKLFGPAPQTTEYEDAAIRRGRELDQRAARGQRIAAGVAGGLGLLGLLTGSDVATGLGQAAAGAGGAIPTDVEEQMRARAEQRRVREQGGIDRENALVNADNEAMRQDAQDDQRAQMAESEMSVNAERARALQAEQADAEFERQALAGNADGMRAAIRARAAAVQHGPTRQAWEQRFADGGPLDQMTDLASLRTILAEVGDTDVRRGGQGAGGSGGGSRETTAWDPFANGGQGGYVTRRVRTGQRSEPSVAPSGSPAPTEQAPRPRPSQPRQPSPVPSGPIDAAQPPVDESTEVAWAERVMRDAGWSGRDRREGVIRRLRTGQGNAAHDTALAEMTELAGRVERTREAGMPTEAVDIDPAEWNRMDTFARAQMTPVVNQRRRALGLLSNLRDWQRNRPLALRAAIATTRDPEAASNYTPDVLAQAQDITRQFSAYVNPMLAERSGAAVTNSEMVRFLREVGLSSALGDLGALERAFDAQVGVWEDTIADRAADLNPVFVRDWARRHGFGGER